MVRAVDLRSSSCQRCTGGAYVTISVERTSLLQSTLLDAEGQASKSTSSRESMVVELMEVHNFAVFMLLLSISHLLANSFLLI